MTKTKVTIHLIRSGGPTEESTVWISDGIIRKAGIPAGSPISLRFGAFKTTVKVASVNKPGQMRISALLASRMGLTDSCVLRLAYRPSLGSIVIGPLMGVIVSRVYSQRPDRPFGNITAFCKELVDAARMQGAYVYFFPPGGIGESRDTIEGWIYDRGWKKGVFPVPDVLHNRLTARKLENQTSVQRLFKDAKARHGTQVFNEKYLDKTEVFSALKKDSSLLRYLPESHAYSGIEILRSMTSKYQTVFLKPIRGSLGKGIIRVAKTGTGSYLCHYSELNGTRKTAYPTFIKLYAALSPRLRSQRFQIQQGLNIATVGGRPLDFRALVQKGLKGAWDVTSIVGRIAGPNHFVSNLAKGGAISPVKTAIARSSIPAGRKKAALSALQKASLHIAKGVESTINAHFGELGVDLAVDKSGRVWLLEVNSKPSKNDNTQLTEGKMRPSVKTLLQYARYLARL